jgi:addiction module HigA family antidote
VGGKHYSVTLERFDDYTDRPPNRTSHMAKKRRPIHPGEILREEFLVPLKLTPYAVAAVLPVPRTRIERIAREEKPVTADTALRLGKFFKTGAAFWMNIQTCFDLETAETCWRRTSRRSRLRRRRERRRSISA